MKDTRYVGILPAENPVSRGQSVNVLLMVDNRGEACTPVVRFYGSDGGPWREIFAGARELPAATHAHLYFNLPASCFAPELWGGETLEELAVWAGETPPAPEEQGILLFFEP